MHRKITMNFDIKHVPTFFCHLFYHKTAPFFSKTWNDLHLSLLFYMINYAQLEFTSIFVLVIHVHVYT